MDDHFGQIVRGIAAARGMEEDAVRALVDRGPFLSGEALEAKLVDGLAYRDEVYAKLRERVDDDGAELLYATAYVERAGRPNSRGQTVALIHGYGTIQRGHSSYSPLDGSIVMGSDTVVAAFRAALRDRRVKAIVFRVDSPGGSPVASDSIWRQTVISKEQEKPIIVSMGNMAGSGGYMVSMAADRIVAEPGTVTGSIGVLGGKLLTRGLWDKIGVSYDDVRTSVNSRMWSTHYDYDEVGDERLNAMLDHIYDDFTGRVAEGRGMSVEAVREVARGRIWSGEQAMENGLVDALGGYETALALVREELGLEPDAPLRVRRYPARRSTLDLLFGHRPDSSDRVAARAMAQALQSLQPKMRMLERLGPLDPEAHQVLRMPEAPQLD
jgi:protease-4